MAIINQEGAPQEAIESLRLPCGRVSSCLKIDVLQANISELVNEGIRLISHARGGGPEPRCAWERSGLTISNHTTQLSKRASLLIDIGGTRTKASFVDIHGNSRLVLDRDNAAFQGGNSRAFLPMRGFVDDLFAAIQEEAPCVVSSSAPIGVGIVWSNQVITQPFALSSVAGITGVVDGIGRGAYRKGEWFVEGLKNGMNLGEIFLEGLSNANITASTFLIGNDTVFSLFATPGAHAGVVVSTGANCTLVDEHQQIHNSELGGHLIIPDNLLSDGDRLAMRRSGRSSVAIEELCAGKWFSEMVEAHLMAAKDAPGGEALAPLVALINNGTLTLNNLLLSRFLRDPLHPPEEFSRLEPETLASVVGLSRILLERAGAVAASLVYLSLIHQVEQGSHDLTVSLDSSMARHQPWFREALNSTLVTLLPPNVKCRVNVVEPVNGISAALQGAANAVQCFVPTS